MLYTNSTLQQAIEFSIYPHWHFWLIISSQFFWELSDLSDDKCVPKQNVKKMRPHTTQKASKFETLPVCLKFLKSFWGFPIHLNNFFCALLFVSLTVYTLYIPVYLIIHTFAHIHCENRVILAASHLKFYPAIGRFSSQPLTSFLLSETSS